MNMMTIAKMEEASRKSWEEQLAGGPRNEEYERIPYELFQHGFVAGVAFAQRQSKIEGSFRAVGNISQYPAAVEEPEEEFEDRHRCLVEPEQPWPRSAS